MPMTGAERVAKHRQRQADRIKELEAKVQELEGSVKFTVPPASKKRMADFVSNAASGGYGSSSAKAGSKHMESFDSFFGGVVEAIAMMVTKDHTQLGVGKALDALDNVSELAARMLLANVSKPGEISFFHGAGQLEVEQWFKTALEIWPLKGEKVLQDG